MPPLNRCSTKGRDGVWAAVEARALGRGGIARVAEATGLSRATIGAGLRELAEGPEDDDAGGRLRGPGAGRKALAVHDSGLVAALETLVDPATRGDPTGPLRWTCSSAARLARELQDAGHRVSERSVNRLLHAALEHARAADEACVAAEAERDQAIAGRDKARQGDLAKKQQRERLAKKLVQDVAEARQEGYTRGKATRASEIDAAQDRALNLQLEVDTLRTRGSAAVQVARREGVAAGRTERDNQVTALEKTVKRLTTERDDRVTALKQTVERLTTQLNAVNQERKRLDGKIENLTEHCEDLSQQLKEAQA